MRAQLILALETSCDETAAAIVEGGRLVRSSVVASQHELHAEYAGVVPEIASRAHVERLVPVVQRALDDSGAAWTDLAAIAVGHRPGLIGSLLVGVAAAKGLAWSLGLPLIGVDHVHAHLYAAELTSAPVPNSPTPSHPAPPPGAGLFPALGLVVSGGHTVLYDVRGPLDLRRLGSTIDDAVGEAFDKAATILGLPQPGGPALEHLARSGNASAHRFPVSRLAPDSLDLSFSGLKTALLYAVRGTPGHPPPAAPPDEPARADLAASFQRAAVDALALKLERALDALNARGAAPRRVIVGGGVSANQALRRAVATLAQQRGLEVSLPEMVWCVDNAAMIAGLAWHRLNAGLVDDLSLCAEPTATC